MAVREYLREECKTSYGDFTVAGAISLRARLRGMGAYDGEADFEGKLQEKRSTLLAELNTQIKVSNATTFMEVA